jgi:2'-5' RNA ligase
MNDSSARLFLALWPPAETRQALLDHADAWAWPERARRTPAERLHVTLHFIGSVPRSRVDELQAALRVPFEAFDLVFSTPELWRGGLAVICADAIPPALEKLHGHLGERLAELGLPVEARPLRVHVTLARDAQAARPPAQVEAVDWRASDGYALVESLPGGRGYRTLQLFG